MPRPLTHRTTASTTLAGPSTRTANRGAGRVLTEPRSTRYLRSVGQLDASGRMAPVDIQKLVDDIHREFTEKYCATPIGILSRCYLGDPFEVHTLALDGSIIEHYRVGQLVPGGLDRARSLALAPAYLAIEVYTDRMVCVRHDGSVVAMESGS